MSKLEYSFKSLDGQYHILISIDETKIAYKVETDIAYLANKEGNIDSKNFLDYLDKAHIDLWKTEDINGSCIEDSTSFILFYNNHTVTGYESYEPYGYEYLIKALMLCDEDFNKLNII